MITGTARLTIVAGIARGGDRGIARREAFLALRTRGRALEDPGDPFEHVGIGFLEGHRIDRDDQVGRLLLRHGPLTDRVESWTQILMSDVEIGAAAVEAFRRRLHRSFLPDHRPGHRRPPGLLPPDQALHRQDYRPLPARLRKLYLHRRQQSVQAFLPFLHGPVGKPRRFRYRVPGSVLVRIVG